MPGTPRELEPKVPSIRIEDLRPDNSFDGSGLSNLRSRRSLRPQTCRPVGRLKLCPAVSGQPLRATQRAPSDQHLAAQEKHRGHWTTFLETATGGSAGNLCETAARVAGTDPLGASSVISRMGQGTQVVPPNCLGPCLPEGISPPPPTPHRPTSSEHRLNMFKESDCAGNLGRCPPSPVKIQRAPDPTKCPNKSRPISRAMFPDVLHTGTSCPTFLRSRSVE